MRDRHELLLAGDHRLDGATAGRALDAHGAISACTRADVGLHLLGHLAMLPKPMGPPVVHVRPTALADVVRRRPGRPSKIRRACATRSSPFSRGDPNGLDQLDVRHHAAYRRRPGQGRGRAPPRGSLACCSAMSRRNAWLSGKPRMMVAPRTSTGRQRLDERLVRRVAPDLRDNAGPCGEQGSEGVVGFGRLSRDPIAGAGFDSTGGAASAGSCTSTGGFGFDRRLWLDRRLPSRAGAPVLCAPQKRARLRRVGWRSV